MLLARILKSLKISKYYDIYNCSYYSFDKAVNGDLKELHKRGIYSELLAQNALYKIIYDKINLFGLEKEYIRAQNLEAEKLILTLQYLTNTKQSAKSRLNILMQKIEQEEEKQKGKASGITTTDLITIISKYYNRPINPKNITVYEVFTTIKNIKEDGNNKRK